MSAPVLTPIGRRRWRTVGSWTGHGVTVPSGYETDLSSIPPIAETVLRMHRNELHFVVGGIVHDRLYFVKDRTRRSADRKFRDVCIAEGAPRWQAMLAYACVRLFGWHRWNRQP